MTIIITWLTNGFSQKREVINYCKSNKASGTYITMNSPIYKAIEDGSFVLDTGYGLWPFEITEINTNLRWVAMKNTE